MATDVKLHDVTEISKETLRTFSGGVTIGGPWDNRDAWKAAYDAMAHTPRVDVGEDGDSTSDDDKAVIYDLRDLFNRPVILEGETLQEANAIIAAAKGSFPGQWEKVTRFLADHHGRSIFSVSW